MVLVTGSTGIVGTRLVFDLLKKGKRVRALKRSGSDTEFVHRVFRFYDPEHGGSLFGKIEWADADLPDVGALADALVDVEEVYHAAALVSYLPGDAERLMKINTAVTTDMVNLSADAGVKKFCHISSVAAVGQSLKGLADENTSRKKGTQRSVYGLSKYLAEREVWRGAAEGMPCIIVNPSIILGPSKPDQSSGMIMDLFRKGSAFTPPGTAGYVDVRDVSGAAIELMESELYDERYILNSENVSFRDMLTWSAEVFGHRPPQYTLQPWMLELAWPVASLARFISGKGPKLTKETARNAARTLGYKNDKVKSATGREFIPVRESLHYLEGFFDLAESA